MRWITILALKTRLLIIFLAYPWLLLMKIFPILNLSLWHFCLLKKSAVSPIEFASASASCSEMAALRAQIVRGCPSSSTAVDVALRSYFQGCDELTVQKYSVFRGSRLVVPASLRPVLVNLTHKGHQGIVRTKQHIRELYWWRGIDCLVKEQIKSYEVCLSSDKTTTLRAAPLQPVPFSSMPREKVAVDIVGPFETICYLGLPVHYDID